MLFQMQGSEARTTRVGRIVGVEGSGFGGPLCAWIVIIAGTAWLKIEHAEKRSNARHNA